MALYPDPEPVTFDTVRQIALALPGVYEDTAYGTPAFRVRKRFLLRLHDSGDAVVVRVEPGDREILIDRDPVTFYVTSHYLAYPRVLVRLATAGRTELTNLLEEAWRAEASPRVVRAFDQERARDAERDARTAPLVPAPPVPAHPAPLPSAPKA